MKVKTAELIGPALDWAVAKCEIKGWFGYSKTGITIKGNWSWQTHKDTYIEYSPSTVWAQGGPIIEREVITLNIAACCFIWVAHKNQPTLMHNSYRQEGETPLIAAIRCYVASKLGDEVDVPEDLLK